MFYYNQYVRAQSLDEAYELYQKKPNFVLGGMLWLKMKNKTLGTAIELWIWTSLRHFQEPRAMCSYQ